MKFILVLRLFDMSIHWRRTRKRYRTVARKSSTRGFTFVRGGLTL